MSDLKRRRDARDIWISRRHLAAGAVLMVLISITSFFLGFWVGRDEAAEPQHTASHSQVPGDDIVELLARVEASALSDGGIEALTFPDSLRGDPGGGPGVPSPGVRPEPAAIEALPRRPGQIAAEGLPPPPKGDFTVQVAVLPLLSEARQQEQAMRLLGIDPWIGAEIAEGHTRYFLAVGGYPSAEEASKILPILTAAGLKGTVVPLLGP